jgi:alpha-maltose-1-phosphate synthase
VRLPRVIVAHPGKQHSPQTALAFQEENLLAGYYTSLWYKPDKFPYSWLGKPGGGIGGSLRSELAKRYYFSALDPDLVVQNPWLMALRILLKRCLRSESLDNLLIYGLNRSFDLWLAARLRALTTGDVLIGYEVSSWKSFQSARKAGIVIILDLASVAWPCQQELFEAEGLTFPGHLLKNIIRLKQRELELADFILVASRLAKNSLRKAGIDDEKASIIPYGTDSERFSQKPDYPRKKKLTLLYVGAVSRHKGVVYLLEALRQLANPDIELLMVGGMGDAAPFLPAYAGLYRHLPFLPQEELVPYYQGADVFVLPSLLEGFGQVTLEAMACGTPVIISDQAGSADVVTDGVNGFVVAARDVGALQEKIRFFYNQRQRLGVFGRAARETAEQFTWEVYRRRVREAVLRAYAGKMGSRFRVPLPVGRVTTA